MGCLLKPYWTSDFRRGPRTSQFYWIPELSAINILDPVSRYRNSRREKSPYFTATGLQGRPRRRMWYCTLPAYKSHRPISYHLPCYLALYLYYPVALGISTVHCTCTVQATFVNVSCTVDNVFGLHLIIIYGSCATFLSDGKLYSVLLYP